MDIVYLCRIGPRDHFTFSKMEDAEKYVMNTLGTCSVWLTADGTTCYGDKKPGKFGSPLATIIPSKVR